MHCARLAIALLALIAAITPATAQESIEMPAMDGDAFEGGAPMMDSGGGDYFSQELGTLLRLRYNTESYGQDRRGNLDIGTMQVTNFQDAIGFFDGQVTVNDVNGVGYDLGVGFRWLHWMPFAGGSERISGLSLWTDGTSTESGSFFPQVGLSYESLGEMWDFRANSYIPVGKDTQIGNFSTTGDIVFSENFLVLEALADQNKSFNVGEIEVARRIMPDRDAWGFAGGYALANNEEDTAGYRLGVRGYAYPDLLLQLAVSNDDIFHTNAAFQVTWFVGRTRSNYQSACGLADRMREPVMRNDYVTLKRTTVTGGEALTNTDGDPFRFVHVNSAAPDGGDGTFENPLNNVGNVEGNSQISDIVLLYANSVFNGQSTLVLQDNQRLLGEGNGEIFTINTLQEGIVDIPETSPGARDGARAIISGMTGAGAVQLADANEVANFNIDGTGSVAGANGIFSPMTGAGNPNIHDINISDISATGTGIQFTPLTRTDEDNAALKTVAGNVTIDDVMFDDMLGIEIDINSATMEDVTNPNVTLQETIAISDVDSQNGNDIGIWLRNTHDNRTATITNYINGTLGTAGSGGGSLTEGVLLFSGTDPDQFEGNVTLTNIDIFNNQGYAVDMANIDATSAFTITTNNGLTYDGGTGMAGGLRFDNFNGTFTGASSTFANGTLSGVDVTGTSDGTITLANTVTFDSIDPGANEAVINVGSEVGDMFTGSLTVNGAVTNHDTGRLVSIQRMTDSTAAVTLAGNMTDEPNAASTGIFIGNNTDGTILFTGDLMIDTTNAKGIEIIANNDNLDINFNGLVDITTDGIGAEGFDASGGGTLTLLGTTNTVTTSGSTGINIDGMVISNGGVNFGMVNVNTGVNGIRLVDNTGGPIVIGATTDMAPDAGIITGTTAEGIIVENSENVTISGIQVDATAGQSGVRVTKTTTGTQTVNLNALAINDGDIGLEVTGNGTGTLNMTINDTDVTGSSDVGISFDDIDTGAIALNNVQVDGMGAMTTAGIRITDSNANFTIDGDSAILGVAGTDFSVDGGTTGTISMAGDITNTAGRSIAVQNRTGGTVTFTSTSAVVDSGAGILVNANSGGTTNFNGTYDLDTGTNTAVAVTNNTGATINFNPGNTAGAFDIDTTTGNGFVATGGGTLTVSGTANTITTTTGRGLNIEGMTIGAVDFESVNVNGADNGIRLVNNLTGTITVGDTGAAVGVGGTIQNTTDDGVVIENTNATLNGVTVTNAGSAVGENAVLVRHGNTANMTTALNNLTINTMHDGLHINGTGGTNTFNVSSTNGTITAAETDLEVQGQLSTVNLTQNITSTAGRSIHVHDVTGGTMTHTGTVSDNGGTGVLITNNTSGTTNLLGTYTLNTGASNAVTITNNTGASMQLTNLNIDTTSGNGFVATGGGTLTVSGTTNTIDTTTGTGLDVEDMTIGAGGVNFQSVTVNGATNGIILDTLTGGQVQVGNAAGAANSGGTLTTTGNAIVLTDVQNVDLRHVRVANAGGDGIAVTHSSTGTTAMDVTIDDLNLDAATGQGIDLIADNDAFSFAMRLTNSDIDNANVVMDVTGAGQFGLLVDSTDITTDPGVAVRAFDLQFHGGATDGDVTIRNGSSFTATDGEALFIDSFDATPKDIKLLVEDSTFTDTLGTEIAAVITNQGTSLMQATIQGNTFASALATRDLNVVTNGTAASQMRLNLGGDITSPADFNTAAGQGTMLVSQNGTSIFGIFDLNGTTVTDTRNNSPVDTNGGVFQNLVVPPVLPTVP